MYFARNFIIAQCRIRKRQLQENNDAAEENLNNIIDYKRGSTPFVSAANMALRRQRQQLMMDNGAKPSCVDFSCDRREAMYTGYLFVSPALNGIIGLPKISN